MTEGISTTHFHPLVFARNIYGKCKHKSGMANHIAIECQTMIGFRVLWEVEDPILLAAKSHHLSFSIVEFFYPLVGENYNLRKLAILLIHFINGKFIFKLLIPVLEATERCWETILVGELEVILHVSMRFATQIWNIGNQYIILYLYIFQGVHHFTALVLFVIWRLSLTSINPFFLLKMLMVREYFGQYQLRVCSVATLIKHIFLIVQEAPLARPSWTVLLSATKADDGGGFIGKECGPGLADPSAIFIDEFGKFSFWGDNEIFIEEVGHPIFARHHHCFYAQNYNFFVAWRQSQIRS